MKRDSPTRVVEPWKEEEEKKKNNNNNEEEEEEEEVEVETSSGTRYKYNLRQEINLKS